MKYVVKHSIDPCICFINTYGKSFDRSIDGVSLSFFDKNKYPRYKFSLSISRYVKKHHRMIFKNNDYRIERYIND